MPLAIWFGFGQSTIVLDAVEVLYKWRFCAPVQCHLWTSYISIIG